MSFDDRNSMDIASLKTLYEETIKKYNDKQDETLYYQCMELNKLIQKREIQERNGQLNYVKCEICNKKVIDSDEAKKEHQQVHKTWVNYKELKKSERKIPPDIEIQATEEKPTELDQVKPEDTKPQDIDVSLKLKKIAEQQHKEDEEFLKTIMEGLKEQPKKQTNIKLTKEPDEELFKEKRSFFKRREKEPKPEKQAKPPKTRDFGFPKRKYHKPHFALKGQFPILEILARGGPLILLKNADRSLEIIKAKKIQGKFVETVLGFFELDGEFENRFNSLTSFYVHNIHNSKPLSVKAVEEIQRYYKDKDAATIVDEMEKIQTAMKKGNESVDPITAMSTIFHQKSKISDNTKKFLIDFVTFDKHDIALLVSDRINTKRPKLDISRPMQTFFPILILGIIGIGTMLVMRFFNPIKIFNISPELFRLSFSLIGAT